MYYMHFEYNIILQVDKDSYALTVDDIASLLSESETLSSDIQASSYSSLESDDDKVSISDKESDEDLESLHEEPDVMNSVRSQSESISVSWYGYMQQVIVTSHPYGLQNDVNVGDGIHSEPEKPPEWFGYKFVGDNIDKNIKPSHQRYELKGQSLHHFHGFAVRDRVNFSGMSEENPTFTIPDPSKFLPSQSDIVERRVHHFNLQVCIYKFYPCIGTYVTL